MNFEQNYNSLMQQMSQLGQLGGFGYGLQQAQSYTSMPFCAVCGESGIHTTDQCRKPKQQENKTMYDAVNSWFKKHSDILVTVAVIFLADHFMFGGKFRHKIEQVVDGLIDKVQKKVDAHEA